MSGEVYRWEEIAGLVYDVEGPTLKATLTATVTVYRLPEDASGEPARLHSDRLVLDREPSRRRFAEAAGTDAEHLATLREWVIAQLTSEPERPDVADVADPEEGVREDGALLLNDVARFLSRYVAYPSDAALIAHALWIVHTHLMDCWDSTPRLDFLSPEPGSGKTRALEASEPLVPRAVEAVNVSAAYLFRKVDDPAGRPTILFDEVDTVFGPKARGDEDVRGLLNAGHRKGAVAGRCVVREKTVETVEFPAYCAVAMAGLGDLPDTILTRSVVIRMRRRKPTETVAPWRRREVLPEAQALYRRIARWATQVQPTITAAWPVMPEGVEDRDADVWEALVAVADAAGGDWPDRARTAAQTLVAEAKQSTPSLGVRLLADLRTVFGDRDSLQTEELLTALCALDEAPWGEIVAGKPLNARGLARRLGAYGIQSANVRQGTSVKKGYRRVDLADAWARYLGELDTPSPESATSATAAPDPEKARDDAKTSEACVADAEVDVADSPLHDAGRATENPHHDADVTDVADVADSEGGGGPTPSVNGHDAGRRCVHCGDPAVAGELYCRQHAGKLAAEPTPLFADDDREVWVI